MQTWYYSSNGERQGPVSFDELKALARRGALDSVKDLAWTEGMQDWTPSGQVAGLYHDLPIPASGSFNPYAAPATASGDLLAPVPAGVLQEIPAGSADLQIMEVVKRAIGLTKRNFAGLIGIGLLFIIISGVVEAILAAVDSAMGWGSTGVLPGGIGSGTPYASPQQGLLISLVSFVFTTFMGLGLNRVALKVASGDDFSVAMLFGEGSKLMRTLGATILYYLMVAVGFLLLIVPGIYLSLRFGLFQYAILDRNLGVMDSFKYSSELTKENRMNLFGLGIMLILIILAGVLALVVGLIFAIPVATLMLPLAYRYLQFGPRALADHPGTSVPLLRGQCPPQ